MKGLAPGQQQLICSLRGDSGDPSRLLAGQTWLHLDRGMREDLTLRRKSASVLLQLATHFSEFVRLPEATSGGGAPLASLKEVCYPGKSPTLASDSASYVKPGKGEL